MCDVYDMRIRHKGLSGKVNRGLIGDCQSNRSSFAWLSLGCLQRGRL